MAVWVRYRVSMENNQTSPMEIEIQSLTLRYSHTRVAKPKVVRMLMSSMDRYGQITPVHCVMEGSHYVLMDGYLRVDALKGLGRDTVRAHAGDSDEQQALLQLLGRTQERQWEAIEQAWIIRELADRFGYRLRDIARSIGYDTSWVSRRMSLLDGLSQEILTTVCSGRMSVFAATRVLVPLARANRAHAEKLCDYLTENPMSTRDLSEFFKNYQRSNRKTREFMIQDPSLLAKALKSKDEKALAEACKDGPEGEWLKDLAIVQAVLKRAMKRLDAVIYPGQDEEDRTRLIRAFEDARSLMERIGDTISKVEP